MQRSARRTATGAALLLLVILALVLSGCGDSRAQTGDDAAPAAAPGAAPSAPQSDEAGETAPPVNDTRTDPGPRAQAAGTTGETVRTVSVVAADTGTLRATRSTSVTVEPLRTARVASLSSGRVLEVANREGALVQSGDLVVRLDDASARANVRNAELQLESARLNLRSAERATGETSVQLEAQLRAAQAQLDGARRQHDEGRALFEVGGISRSDVTALEAQLAQAEAALLQAQDGLARSRRSVDEDIALLRLQVQQAEVAVQNARDALAETRVVAPFDGEVSELFIEEGEFLGAGSPVFSLVSGEGQLARFRIPPDDARGLVGRELLWIRHGGLDYAARVVRSSSVPGQQRLVELVAEVYDSSDPMPSGTVAQLRYDVELGAGIVLPSGAVSAEAGQNFVFVVEEGVAVRRVVRVVAEAGGRIVVEGLEPGERVVHPRPLDVREGTRVRIGGS